jgi:hypothetical protein
VYRPEAIARRRCLGTRKDGQPCQAWAVWDDPRQLCMAHAGRHHRGPHPQPWVFRMYPTRYPPCTCPAYNWPHRPGSGVCEWPNLDPRWQCTTTAGTHEWPRMYGSTRSLARVLARHYRRKRGR